MASTQLVRRLDAARNCIHVSAEELKIEWGGNPEYWEMVPNHDTALFSKKIAKLKTVCWFDVKGEVLCSLPPGTYTVSWRAKLIASTAEGWEHDAVNFTFSEKLLIDRGEEKKNSCSGEEEEMFRWKCYLQGPRSAYPEPRIRYVGNGWTEYDVGDFAVEAGEHGNLLLEIAMLATGGDWKTDLSLDGIFIRPISSSAAGGFSKQVRRLDTARNCIHVSAEELQIEWRDSPQYWQMVPNHDTALFSKKIARLITVCWFDVKGWAVCSLPPGTYTVSWRAKLNANAGGWEHEVVSFSVSKKQIDGSEEMTIVSREEMSRCKCYLRGPRSAASPAPKIRDVGNGWKEYDVGEFAVGAGGPGNFVLEIDMLSHSGNWKSDLSLDGIFIRPKSSCA